MQVIKKSVDDSILSAAEKEFSEKGYSASSIRAIASSAKTSVGNIYKYYPGKEKLFLAVVMPTADECIDLVDKTLTFTDEALAKEAVYMADYIDSHRAVFRALFSGPSGHYAAFMDRYTECVAKKLREYTSEHIPEASALVSNPTFFNALAAAFVGGIRPIIEHFSGKDEAEKYLNELFKFLFSDFDNRIAALEKK